MSPFKINEASIALAMRAAYRRVTSLDTAREAVLEDLAMQLRPHVPGARDDEGLEALLGRLVANQRPFEPLRTYHHSVGQDDGTYTCGMPCKVGSYGTPIEHAVTCVACVERMRRDALQCPPALLADIRRELSKTRPAAPTLDERGELLDLLQRVAAERPPEPPADLVERLARVSWDAESAVCRIAYGPWEDDQAPERAVHLAGIRAVPLSAGDVWEWLPNTGTIREGLPTNLIPLFDEGRWAALVEAVIHVVASHLAPRLMALRARVQELEAELGELRARVGSGVGRCGKCHSVHPIAWTCPPGPVSNGGRS